MGDLLHTLHADQQALDAAGDGSTAASVIATRAAHFSAHVQGRPKAEGLHFSAWAESNGGQSVRMYASTGSCMLTEDLTIGEAKACANALLAAIAVAEANAAARLSADKAAWQRALTAGSTKPTPMQAQAASQGCAA